MVNNSDGETHEREHYVVGEPQIEPSDRWWDQLGTEGRVHTTVERESFYRRLKPGDVILFSSLDDLGVLGESIERRPVYHSSLYLGEFDDNADEPRKRHVVMHNLSYVWWRDSINKRPARSEPGLGAAADYWIPSTVEDYVPADEKDQRDARTQALASLQRVGGVGPTFIDAYLDVDQSEALWSHMEPAYVDPYVPRTQRVRKIRMAVALRHVDLLDAVPDRAAVREKRERLLQQMGDLARQWNTAPAGGFPAAELAALVPTLGQRPGFQLMVPGQVTSMVGIAAIHHHPTGGEKAICAMYCAEAMREAELALDMDSVALFYDKDRRYHTPRDLWDCQQLRPVTMLVVPPDRGDDYRAPAAKPERSETEAPGQSRETATTRVAAAAEVAAAEDGEAVAEAPIELAMLQAGFEYLDALNSQLVTAAIASLDTAEDSAPFLQLVERLVAEVGGLDTNQMEVLFQRLFSQVELLPALLRGMLGGDDGGPTTTLT